MEQYLTFTLGQEQYGLEILKVQEIRSHTPTTPIPNAPRYVRGVMNLRGAIIPVIDLRSKLLLAEGEFTPVTAVVVVTVKSKTLGLVVDSVTDVLDIEKASIQPVPDFGARVDTRFLTGLAQAGDGLVILLDLERIVSADEIAPAMSAA